MRTQKVEVVLKILEQLEKRAEKLLRYTSTESRKRERDNGYSEILEQISELVEILAEHEDFNGIYEILKEQDIMLQTKDFMGEKSRITARIKNIRQYIR